MFLIAIALSTLSAPDRWVRIGGADGQEEYVDTQSLTRSGDKAMVWTRRDFTAPPATLWHELEFDCRRRTETIVAFIRDEGGTVTHNFDRPYRGAAPIAPNSVAERVYEVACR